MLQKLKMTPRYHIEISNIFYKNRFVKYGEKSDIFINGFILWLVFQRIVVSFSSDKTTRVNGKDTAKDDIASEIFFRLVNKYNKVNERNNKVKYDIRLAKIYKERPESKKINDRVKRFMVWLRKEGHTVNFSKNNFTTINGKIAIQDTKLLKIYTELNVEYSKTIENNGTNRSTKNV
ncbi:MAG: hypothetical protein ABW166_19350 [Sedimenticola sp.]